MVQADTEKLVYSVEEASKLLGLSRSTIAGMLRRSELPGIVIREGRGACRTRRTYRVREDDLERWIERRRQETRKATA